MAPIITTQQIQDAVSASAYPWSAGDDVLYDLCERSPEHSDVKVVIAKLWLIGRAYSAAIERLRRSGELTTSALYVRVAQDLIGSDIDHHIQLLRGVGPLNKTNVRNVLEAHKHLVDTIGANTDKSPRSFASKYLHFHAPQAVPVFDSYADGTIRKWMPRWRDRSGMSKSNDAPYSSFVVRVLAGLDRVEDEHGARLTLKQLDRLLWIEGEERAVRTV